MSKNQCCSNCKWWKYKQVDAGYCHYFLLKKIKPFWVWPRATLKGDGVDCRAHRKKK